MSGGRGGEPLVSPLSRPFVLTRAAACGPEIAGPGPASDGGTADTNGSGTAGGSGTVGGSDTTGGMPSACGQGFPEVPCEAVPDCVTVRGYEIFEDIEWGTYCSIAPDPIGCAPTPCEPYAGTACPEEFTSSLDRARWISEECVPVGWVPCMVGGHCVL